MGKKLGKTPDFASIVNADVSCGHRTDLAVLPGLETLARVGPGACAGWLCAHTLPARQPHAVQNDRMTDYPQK